jgi:hypothetical protein
MFTGEDTPGSFGNCRPKSWLNRAGTMVFVKITTADYNLCKSNLKQHLKDGEILCRYVVDENHPVFCGPILIKINHQKELVYFLTQESFNGETDEIVFDRKGVACEFFNLWEAPNGF